MATGDAMVISTPWTQRERGPVKAATGQKKAASERPAQKRVGSSREPVEPADETSEQSGVRSVQRALDILTLLTEDRPLRRAVLARLSEEPGLRPMDGPVDAVVGALRLAAKAAGG